MNDKKVKTGLASRKIYDLKALNEMYYKHKQQLRDANLKPSDFIIYASKIYRDAIVNMYTNAKDTDTMLAEELKVLEEYAKLDLLEKKRGLQDE